MKPETGDTTSTLLFAIEAIHATRMRDRFFRNGHHSRVTTEPLCERRIYTDKESFDKDMFYLSQCFEWPVVGVKRARYLMVYPSSPHAGVVWC